MHILSQTVLDSLGVRMNEGGLEFDELPPFPTLDMVLTWPVAHVTVDGETFFHCPCGATRFALPHQCVCPHCQAVMPEVKLAQHWELGFQDLQYQCSCGFRGTSRSIPRFEES